MPKVRPTNGVSFGLKYTVTAADVSATLVDFDFRIADDDFRFDLVAVVQILNSSNVVTNPANLAITYPSKGVVRVAGTLVLNSIIQLIAQADSQSF